MHPFRFTETARSLFGSSWTRGLAIAVAAGAVAATAGGQVPSLPDRQPVRADNYYSAGNRIDITTAMAGDVIVAARQVDINAPVTGDILAAGWRVTLAAQADDDVRIAGGEVVVNAPVNGDLTVTGGTVTIGRQTHVGGRSWIAGQTVRVDGILDRDLYVAGATVQIAGEIRQPIQVVAERLEILSTARILAPLAYKGPSEMRIGDGAVINGPVTYDRIPAREARRARDFPAVSSVLFAAHLFLAGLLVVMVLPRFETSTVATLRAWPGKSLLAGFVVLVTTPVVALLLVVSVFGLPFGLALGAIYAIALFAGVLATAFFVGDVEARLLKVGPIVTRRRHTLLLFGGVLTLVLLRGLFGGVVVLMSALFGLGALILWVYDAYSSTSAPTAA
jgi:hypothetical protein